MSYLVLARKYRPGKFSEIIGQEHINRTLKNAIKENKIAHAYLFSGQRGIGKTTTARILAKAVNCKKVSGQEPCGKCDICREIDSSSSVDVIEIDAASNRGIDEIRQLRENIKFAPATCKYKIYIIDEVHMLTPEAFNAMLKSLEEPPSHVIFIMATTEPDKVLNTISSRCQSFSFRPISEEKIVEALKEIASKEKTKYEEEGIRMIARSAGGSMRDAQSIMDQALSYGSGKITSEETAELLGIIPGRFLFKLSGYIKDENPAEALTYSAQLYSEGCSPSRLHQDLMFHFRNLMMAKVFQGDSSALGFDEDYCNRLSKSAEGFDKERLLWITDFLEKNTYRIKHSEVPRVVMDTIIFKLCEKFVSFEDIIKASSGYSGKPPVDDKDEKPLTTTVVKQEEKLDDYKSPSPPVSEMKPPRPGGKWEEILKLVRRKSHPLYHTLKDARTGLKGNTVTVIYDNPLKISKEKEQILKEKIRDILGKDYSLSLKQAPAAPEKKTEYTEIQVKKRFDPLEIEEEEPAVSDIINIFDGQIEEQYRREKE